MKPELLILLEKSRQSLQAAELLHREGYFDFAVSRSYYAMFYLAQLLLLSLGQSYSSHTAVLGAFGREFAKTGKLDSKFHRYIIDAQDFRNVGDYGIETHVSKEQAEKIGLWSREFLAAVEDYLAAQS